MKNLSHEIINIIIGMFLCLIGGILLDFHVNCTGAILVGLGVFAILLGPVAVDMFK